ncbi:alanine racemase [Galactobacter sp.]|uniref:alanine racemase n=1 Tax=Galactobacter sp. TaxID=2676125 RepID=UPI0025BFB5FE|nr:alanine racemase [Galactobacter sp.]
MTRTTPPPEHFARMEAALADAVLNQRPVAVLDASALRANLKDLTRRAASTPIRLASKSIRVRELQRRILDHDGFQGTLCFTLPEALFLSSHGFTDLVIAYPTADGPALRQLAGDAEARAAITLMVDDEAHLDLMDALAPNHPAFRIALDLDTAYRPVKQVWIGSARSPIRTPQDLTRLASTVVRRRGYRLVGMMAYEGQIAGVGNAGRGPRATMVRAMQARSAQELRARRAEAVAAVSRLGALEFVNGGGTGSLESTSAEEAVTEVAAGSGVFGPGLFDHYRHFSPQHALHFGLDVVRRPAPGIATVLGGGWVASGAPGQDRLPTVAWPHGLSYRGTEGAGEVQTPLVGESADTLKVGDVVWMRHAKAGELCERVNEIVVVEDGTVSDVLPTYRGEGKAFL